MRSSHSGNLDRCLGEIHIRNTRYYNKHVKRCWLEYLNPALHLPTHGHQGRAVFLFCDLEKKHSMSKHIKMTHSQRDKSSTMVSGGSRVSCRRAVNPWIPYFFQMSKKLHIHSKMDLFASWPKSPLNPPPKFSQTVVDPGFPRGEGGNRKGSGGNLLF